MINTFFGNDDEYKYGAKYKFKSLKVYCSGEWMFGATKKYRQVFDKSEIDYVSVEFSFYNKLFDEKEWKAEIRIKAFEITGSKKKEISDQKEDITVSKDDNIVKIYKGWGSDKLGNFWKRGGYVWEAYIDNEFVASKNFFVEDVGKISQGSNPFFDVVSLKLYKGEYDGWSQKERTYLKKFDRENTRFIWAELKTKNKINTAWNIELFMNFYDDAGQLKGQSITLDKIKQKTKGKVSTFQEGWGSKSGGSWKDEKYTCEIVFMDTLVAIVPFEVGNEDVEGIVEVQTTQEFSPVETASAQEEIEESMEDLLLKLDELIGLKDVKKKIKDNLNYLDFLKLRKEKGFDDEERISLHSIFTGNPGTGKTTVVNLLGKLYAKMGLLSKGHIHEVDRADLVGEYIGQTAPKVKAAIDEARGGILFIDEAYMLVRNDADSKDYGREVVEVLLKEMSDGEGDIAIMAAGYPKEMRVFINANPGLRSRFNYFFHFDDYIPSELLDIARFAASKRAVTLTDGAWNSVKKVLINAYRERDKSFGNARYSYSLIDEGKMNLGLRLIIHPDVRNLPNEVLSTVQEDDIKKIVHKKQRKKINIEIDEVLLRDTLQELNLLVGLRAIKDDVTELVKLVRYYRESGKDVLNRFSLHTVFTGNPGTGKTTVARIMGKIFKALGLLERGHVVETDREGIIAGYSGQTAIKTKEKLDSALGGVLFIDEAYALSDGNHSYGAEAIQVILKQMEDNRGKIAIIAAGYPDNMEKFLKANPGLKSRFDRTFVFKDFTPNELFAISKSMLSLENLIPDTEATKHLKNHFAGLHNRRDRYFGNARTIRKIVVETVKKQHLRMANLDSTLRTFEIMETLTLEDVKQLNLKNVRSGGIGFKYQ